jgi:hypothetical protein
MYEGYDNLFQTGILCSKKAVYHKSLHTPFPSLLPPQFLVDCCFFCPCHHCCWVWAWAWVFTLKIFRIGISCLEALPPSCYCQAATVVAKLPLPQSCQCRCRCCAAAAPAALPLPLCCRQAAATAAKLPAPAKLLGAGVGVGVGMGVGVGAATPAKLLLPPPS